MPTADTINLTNETLMMLLKGSVGIGKTLAATSAAVEGPVFLAYWDKKAPVELLNFLKNIKREDLLKRIEYEIYGANNAIQYLNKLISLTKSNDKFAIITDSVTSMTTSAVNWSLGFRNPTGAKKDSLNANNPLVVPDFEEYKVETGLITQALDISRSIKSHIIWIAHPVPSLKIEGGGNTGNRTSVSKVNNIVTYGSKVGALIPAQFTEIYHFSRVNEWDGTQGKNIERRIVNTRGIGDDFAKTALNLPDEFDITDKLFWEVWSSLVKG